jgi:tetratricopeptide (TPR) repeat protein
MNFQTTQAKLERYLSFLKKDETNLNLLADISTLYNELEDAPKAQYYLDKIKCLNPRVYLITHGIWDLRKNQLPKALEYFRQALAYGNSDELYYHLGVTYYRMGQFESACSNLTFIKSVDYLPSTQLLMARILHQQNALSEAIELVNNVIYNEPNNAEALAFLSLLHFDNNQADLAKKLSQQALALDTNVYEARLVGCQLGLATNETKVEEVYQLIEINPEDCRLWFTLGSTLVNEGDLISAVDHLSHALELNPQFYDCYIILAWCQLLTHEMHHAQATYQKAISLQEHLADGWAGLALIHALNKDLTTAEQFISKAKHLNEDCFLTDLAQVICLNYKNPRQAQDYLFSRLSSQKMTDSESILIIINELIKNSPVIN